MTACTSYIDAQLGKVLATLDATGQRENTVIVFWSDHGRRLDDNGCRGKHTSFERHGGSIVANSQPGQGARFTVHLPCGTNGNPREETSDESPAD